MGKRVALVCLFQLATCQLIEKRCFQETGEFAGSNLVGDDFSTRDQLFDSNIFKPDMKLHRVYVCSSAVGDQQIVGINFTLRTLASEAVIKHEFDTIGRVGRANCKPYFVPDASYVEYIEVTHSKTYIDSVVIKLSNEYYSFWGTKRGGKTTKWSFSKTWQPVGLTGTFNQGGVLSLSPISYSVDCADRALGIQTIPLGQEYNDSIDNQVAVYDYSRYQRNKDDDVNWFTDLNEQTGFPIYQYLIAIVATMSLALIIGVLCRCLKKKRKNKIDKDADFSFSEEERRATVVKTQVLRDIAERDETLSKVSAVNNLTKSDRGTMEEIATEDFFNGMTERNLIHRGSTKSSSLLQELQLRSQLQRDSIKQRRSSSFRKITPAAKSTMPVLATYRSTDSQGAVRQQANRQQNHSQSRTPAARLPQKNASYEAYGFSEYGEMQKRNVGHHRRANSQDHFRERHEGGELTELHNQNTLRLSTIQIQSGEDSIHDSASRSRSSHR